MRPIDDVGSVGGLRTSSLHICPGPFQTPVYAFVDSFGSKYGPVSYSVSPSERQC